MGLLMMFSKTVVTIREIRSRSKAYKFYEVTIYNRAVYTTVTSSRKEATRWIKDHLLHAPSRYQKIVGLDIEWRPSFIRGSVQNPAAILQLCIGKCCLIFQLYRASGIPRALYRALSNPDITYTGVKISGDVKKLFRDYDLEVSDAEDVGKLAAQEYDHKEFRRAGLRTLVEDIMGEEIEKPKYVTMSDWDAKHLTHAQVAYASVDAYYSYKLGKILLCD